MAGSNGPRDGGAKNNLRSDPAKGGTPELRSPTAAAPPAEASDKKSRWWVRLPRAFGSAIAAPFRLASHGISRIRSALVTAAGAVRASAGSLFRREVLSSAAAVVAVAAAVLAWTGAISTETRRVSEDLRRQFDSEEMWKARLTLQRYYYLLSGDRTAPADLARQTEDYFKALVYQKAALPAGRLSQDRNKFGSDRDKQEEFLRQVDHSRQTIKNFYEDVIVFSERGLLTSAFREKVLRTRFYRNGGDFLECFWLPVELGQNAALYQRKADNEKRACQVVDWYRENYPVAGRPATACVPYASRQPDFCVDPKVEVVASE